MTQQPIPDLATSGQVSDDSTVYTFAQQLGLTSSFPTVARRAAPASSARTIRSRRIQRIRSRHASLASSSQLESQQYRML